MVEGAWYQGVGEGDEKVRGMGLEIGKEGKGGGMRRI